MQSFPTEHAQKKGEARAGPHASQPQGLAAKPAGLGAPGLMQGSGRDSSSVAAKGVAWEGKWAQRQACTALPWPASVEGAFDATAGPESARPAPLRRPPSQVHFVGHARGSVGLQLVVIRVVPSTIGRLTQLDHQFAESSAAAARWEWDQLGARGKRHAEVRRVATHVRRVRGRAASALSLCTQASMSPVRPP